MTLPGGGGDVGPAGQTEQADGGVAQGCHDVGCVAGADLGAVFVVGDVADPVESVLDAPVALDPGGQGRWRGGGVVGGGDDVDDLDTLGTVLGDGAAELGDLGGAGEGDPDWGVDDFDGAGGSAAVFALGGCDSLIWPRVWRF